MRRKSAIAKRPGTGSAPTSSAPTTSVPNSSASAVRAGGSHRVATFAAALVLVVCGLAAYSDSLGGDFVYDDSFDIVSNKAIRSLSPPWGPFIRHDETGWHLHTRPVVVLSFALNYAWAELATLPYHATNLAIHLLAGLTLFGLVRHTLRLPSLERYASAATGLALAVATLWTVHPLNTQAVTYIVQRYESLMGLFYLLAMYCAARAMTAERPLRWSIASIVSCALALGCKEVAVSLPIMVLLYDRAYVSGSFGEAWRRRGGMYVGLFGVLLVFLPIFKIFSGGEGNWAGHGIKIPWYSYAISQAGVVLHYLRLAFWPTGQCLDYGWPVANTPAQIVPPLLAIGTLLGLTLWLNIHRPAVGFLGAWFFLILAPTSSVMPIVDLAYEHRMYLSLAAVIAAAVLGAWTLVEYRAPLARGAQARAALLTAAAIAAIVALGLTTFERNRAWASQVSIWTDNVQKAPRSSRGRSNLGNTLIENRDLARAKTELLEAIRLDPLNADAHAGLGRLYLEDRDLASARSELEEAFRINPNSAMANANLAMTLFEMGDLTGAQKHFEIAFSLEPDDSKLHHIYAGFLTRTNNSAGAKQHMQEAVRVDPSNANAHFDLGNLLASEGDFAAAFEQWQLTLQLAPGHAPAHLNIARALALQGARAEALRFAQEALRLDPTSDEARALVTQLTSGSPTQP